MAGAFGYGADHYDVSMRMAELSLLPAVRTRRCRHADRRRRHELPAPDRRRHARRPDARDAVHAIRVLARALPTAHGDGATTHGRAQPMTHGGRTPRRRRPT